MFTLKRKAFSLLELVFVILIAGILAAVALPRFIGISEDAHITKLQAFVGTLNRSVAPAMWSNVQKKEPAQNGRVGDSLNYHAIREGIELNTIPDEFINLGVPRTIPLANCMVSSTLIPDIGDPVGSLTDGKVAGTAAIGEKTYALGCVDGSLSISPRFYLYNETDGLMVY
ncbi:MAG: type II secretion system protein [Sulfurimonas sp.]